MKLMKMMLCFGTLALAVATAENRYSLTLSSPTWVDVTELKPGNYKVEMRGENAVFTVGKSTVEAPAAIVDAGRKYQQTGIETGAGSKLTAIQLGGTTTKIVLKSAQSTAGN